MAIEIDLSKVYQKLSDSNMQAGRVAMANQILTDTNENFVPMRDGNLRDFVGIAIDGSSIFWYSVYAKAQYYGTNGKAVFSNYTTPGTGPRWDEKAKGVFISDWVDAFVKGAKL
ncbi:minor capsid protein [Vagococcus fluvialis]|uniref:minor capsid protein n=1 Tax=Vagococcus fluvialis TaxID=2738 RepID=UPI001D0ADCE6|nr:minor capsid protein [Vagococcus fluvialis]UDM79599.1 minor capsid protein [Vagococcus fluvialis]